MFIDPSPHHQAADTSHLVLLWPLGFIMELPLQLWMHYYLLFIQPPYSSPFFVKALATYFNSCLFFYVQYNLQCGSHVDYLLSKLALSYWHGFVEYCYKEGIVQAGTVHILFLPYYAGCRWNLKRNRFQAELQHINRMIQQYQPIRICARRDHLLKLCILLIIIQFLGNIQDLK